MMNECVLSEILDQKIGKSIRIQTMAGATVSGKIEAVDCRGVLFVPDEPADFDTAYIFYHDLKKVMMI